MTAAPDPKVVCEIARKLIAASANKVFAEDIFHASYGAVPASASGYPDPAKVGALHTAVEEAIRTANTTVTVSWPGEQPQDEREPLHDEYGIRATYVSTLTVEFAVADNLGDALKALEKFDAEHPKNVIRRKLIQRKAGDWHDIDEDGDGRG